MKRKNWLSILCCGIMALNTISCQDSTGTENTGGSGDGAIVITSEDAQKELDRVGKDLMQNINLEKVKPVVELTDFCLHEFPEFQDAIDEIPIYFIMRQTQNVIDGDLTSIATRDLSTVFPQFELDIEPKVFLKPSRMSSTEALSRNESQEFNHILGRLSIMSSWQKTVYSSWPNWSSSQHIRQLQMRKLVASVNMLLTVILEISTC